MRLRVVTLNVWGLPWGIARHRERRLRAIGASLADYEADVFAFQEVWLEAERRELAARGAEAGLPHSWHLAGGIGSGGLLVLSRHPILGTRFEPYALKGFPERVWHGDYWSGKGFAALRLQTPAGELVLVDTHLHSQYADDARDDYRPHRFGAVVQLAAALAEIGEPVVAAGDFNLHDAQPIYGALLGLTRLRDSAAELDRRLATSLASNPYRQKRTGTDTRIDYVLFRDGRARAVRPLRVERVFDERLELEGAPGAPSDHAGVLADLEIAPGADLAAPAPSAEAAALARSSLEAGRSAAAERRGARRASALGALAVGGVALSARPRVGSSRRRVLGALLLAGGALALPAGVGLVALSEHYAPEEMQAFDRVLAQLERLEARL